MNNRICSFCGHRDCDLSLKIQTKNEIMDLIKNVGINIFYSGGMGAFDNLCESVVCEMKRTYDIKLCLVVPYFTQQLNKNKEYYTSRYDEIIVPDLGDVHYKRAIGVRNKWIVEQSDVLLCYVVRGSGGAYQMLQYARKMNKTIRKLE